MSPTPGPTLEPGSAAKQPGKPPKRACDWCRKRKVRCDSLRPCTACKKSSIFCRYDEPARKKGPKRLRSTRVLYDAARSNQFSLRPDHAAGGDPRLGVHAVTTAYASTTHCEQATEHPAPGKHGTQVHVVPGGHVFHQQGLVASPHPLQPLQTPAVYLPPEPHQRGSWTSSHADSQFSPVESRDTMRSSTSTEPYHGPRGLRGEMLRPYVQLFFTHMFAIMPVIDRDIFLDPALYADGSPLMSSERYCFLCALCAATIVQLDDSVRPPAPFHPTRRSDAVLVEECLRERNTFDHIGNVSALSVMTSFFLFAYFGNHEQHNKAWHSLQESITFAQILNMDSDKSYDDLDPGELQWRRRLYWLLFITERAYAVQRQKHTRLHTSVQLPAVLESEDSKLLNGFVNLAELFSAVDDSFVSAWRSPKQLREKLIDVAWMRRTRKQLDDTARAFGLTETQDLDIGVTRVWLHVLAWQMAVSNGLLNSKEVALDYPVILAKNAVAITSRANPLALDSHGIGMEQKLTDIAGCLADVIGCMRHTDEPKQLRVVVDGQQYLRVLFKTLSSMRGKESRYLQPLMRKVRERVGWNVEQGFTLLTDISLRAPAGYVLRPIDAPLSPERCSMADSIGKLRTLSDNGDLGMPGIAVPRGDWEMHRPDDRELDETQPQAWHSA